jgi:AcrR family transcriptional regulator
MGENGKALSEGAAPKAVAAPGPARVTLSVPDHARREGGHVLEMQRRRLLLACGEALAERGLEGASVDRICKRAGVSRRTFYDLFDDREGCMLAAFELAIEQTAARLAPAYMPEAGTVRARGTPRARSWRERVRAALTALLELFDAEPGLARLCVVETLKGGPTVLERRRRALDALVTAVDEGRGECRGASPPPLTAEGTVGGVMSVIHTRLVEHLPSASRVPSTTDLSTTDPSATDFSAMGRPAAEPLMALVNPLMSMIVHPYLGSAAARRELEHPVPQVASARNGHTPARVQDPFKDLPIRITFRTARVLATIGSKPGASNRAVGDAAGVADQGQISKLLRRLASNGLISNHGQGHADGEPNAWTLTERGAAIQRTIDPPDF